LQVQITRRRCRRASWRCGCWSESGHRAWSPRRSTRVCASHQPHTRTRNTHTRATLTVGRSRVIHAAAASDATTARTPGVHPHLRMGAPAQGPAAAHTAHTAPHTPHSPHSPHTHGVGGAA
jgi:hypothetical protein